MAIGSRSCFALGDAGQLHDPSGVLGGGEKLDRNVGLYRGSLFWSGAGLTVASAFIYEGAIERIYSTSGSFMHPMTFRGTLFPLPERPSSAIISPVCVVF